MTFNSCGSVGTFNKFLVILESKERVAEEEGVSKKLGLGICLLPTTEEDAATAAGMEFSSKFERNKKEKRTLINYASIFLGSFGSSMSTDKTRLELGSKRRKFKAGIASELLIGGFKQSSWSKSSASSSSRSSRGIGIAAALRHL